MQSDMSAHMTILSRLVDAASDAIIVVDDCNTIIYANQGVVRVFGWPAADLVIGQKLDCLLPRDAVAHHHSFMKAFSGAGGVEARQMGRQAEIRGMRQNGEEFPADISIVSDTIDGRLVFAAIVRDISERKLRNQQIERSNMRLKNSQRIAGLGSWDLDLRTRELSWSEEVYRIFNIDRDDFGASYDAFLSHVHPEDRERVQQSVETAIRNRDEYSIVHRILTGTGEVRYVQEQAAIILDQDEEPVEIEGVVQDITERVLAQEELRRAHAAAISANDAKDRFLATMSHELRTPLNAIIGFSEAMKQQIFGPISERYRQYATDISKSGRHLLAHIQGILEITRSFGEAVDLKEEWFNLRELLEDCVKVICIAPVDAKLNIRITHCDRNIRLYADRLKCYQVLTNVLWNAVKFSSAGSPIALSVSNPGAQSGLTITIQDYGIGIPPEKLDVIRQPFVKLANPQLANPNDGIGLGLHIVQSLMEAHDGCLDIESTINQGTRVSVTFPASRISGTGTAGKS